MTMEMIEALRAIVGDAGVLEAADVATRSARGARRRLAAWPR